ncbi:unnamed protein product, partial [Ectocarpus sp. 13 AM-2016]
PGEPVEHAGESRQNVPVEFSWRPVDVTHGVRQPGVVVVTPGESQTMLLDVHLDASRKYSSALVCVNSPEVRLAATLATTYHGKCAATRGPCHFTSGHKTFERRCWTLSTRMRPRRSNTGRAWLRNRLPAGVDPTKMELVRTQIL